MFELRFHGFTPGTGRIVPRRPRRRASRCDRADQTTLACAWHVLRTTHNGTETHSTHTCTIHTHVRFQTTHRDTGPQRKLWRSCRWTSSHATLRCVVENFLPPLKWFLVLTFIPGQFFPQGANAIRANVENILRQRTPSFAVREFSHCGVLSSPPRNRSGEIGSV